MNSRSIYSRISLILVATVIWGTSSVAIPHSVGYSDTPNTMDSGPILQSRPILEI